MFNLTLTAANTLSALTTTIDATLTAYDWTRQHGAIGLRFTRLGLSQSWLYAKLTYRFLTSKDAIAFYGFVWNLCQLAFYACKWGVEVARDNMDRYVEVCQVGPENHQELRDFDAKLEAPTPAPVEVEIEPDALVSVVIAEDVAEEEAIEPGMVEVAEVIPSAELPADGIDETETSEPVEDAPEYEKMGLRQLRVICTQKGCKNAARWNKAKCLEALLTA